MGRYDKIHLVPFGEYIPFQQLLLLRAQANRQGLDVRARRRSAKSSACERRTRYGIFICYEAVFADEVRQFAQLGAEVLVNISDDGWYGDTSAPWQHLNMARMRAIENHRWILRDTNNGSHRGHRSLRPRHARASRATCRRACRPNTASATTSPSTLAHGDVFAWLVPYCLVAGLVSGNCVLLPAQPARRKFKPSQVLRAICVNDLEYAYAPVRDQVRDLREYL